jgi:hypothetical protein
MPICNCGMHYIRSELPDLSMIEWPAIEEPDESYALFDSRRSYVDQVEHFKRRQNGNGRVRLEPK